ncbi:MAG: HAD family hydrolase [archaeon]
MKPESPFKAVLFDLDGTLCDSLPLFVETYRRTFARMNLTIPEKEIPFSCFGKTESEICAGIGRPELAKEFAKSYFSELRSVLIPKVRPTPGAVQILEFLRARKIKLAIVSMAYRWYVDAILAKLGISESFGAIVGKEDVREQKPAPDAAILACGKLGVSPSEALVVGDTASDILMGNSAGCCMTALYHPASYARFFRKTELLAAKPAHCFGKLSELRGFFS